MNEQTKNKLDTIFDIDVISATDTIIPSTTDIIPAIDILPVSADSVVPEETPEEKIAKEDFEFSRSAIKDIANEAQTTLHRAVDVANQTDTPRAFEAVADLLRATLEAHKELQGIHKTAAEIRLTTKTAQAPPPGSVNIQQGVVFSGTSEDLLRLISKDRQ
jgi:hypothetical protein